MKYSLALLILCVVFLLIGCNDNRSELEIVLEPYKQMPVAEQELALKGLIEGKPEYAHYGLWQLGNLMYDKAIELRADAGGSIKDDCKALLDSALVFYDLSAAADTNFVEAYANAGIVWDELSEAHTPDAHLAFDQAEKYYLKAIEVDSLAINSRVNLGSLLFKKKHFTEAIEQYQTAIDIDPKSAVAHYQLGLMFAESKIYREALIEWKLAAKYDPDGQTGQQARENIPVIEGLMNAEVPEELTKKKSGKTKMPEVNPKKAIRSK